MVASSSQGLSIWKSQPLKCSSPALPGPPLLLLVGADALVQPVSAWLEEEISAGANRQVGKTKVAALTGSDGAASMEAALLDGLSWLAPHTPVQLPLKVIGTMVSFRCTEQS